MPVRIFSLISSGKPISRLGLKVAKKGKLLLENAQDVFVKPSNVVNGTTKKVSTGFAQKLVKAPKFLVNVVKNEIGIFKNTLHIGKVAKKMKLDKKPIVYQLGYLNKKVGPLPVIFTAIGTFVPIPLAQPAGYVIGRCLGKVYKGFSNLLKNKLIV